MLGAHVDKPATREMYGPFQVFERLGVGGMAIVHRAIERGIEGFEREVALKRLLPHLAEDEAFVRLFVREAKLASLLQHGNIVQLYELGRVGPSYFISMEYIAGRDLRAAIRQARRVVGPPPVAISLAILSELLDALDYAHSRRDEAGEPLGLVHRDISPSNLLINESGHLKVIDFGVAKATHGQLQTHTGGIKGKLSYLPPEMLTGRPLDGRSDLFSASVIAHELFTTVPLFTGDSELQTIDRVQRMTPPPPSAKNRDCPPELDAIVLKGLAKEPDRRWSSAAEMRAELAELAVRFRLHATSREVAGWMDWAFGPGAVRRPLPLSAPEATPSQPSNSASDRSPVVLNEGEFEAAWDWLRSSAAPILLAEVPDVSDRLVAPRGGPARAAEPDDDAPTVIAVAEPVSALSWADGFVAREDPTVTLRPVWLGLPRARRDPDPVEWADGTEPESAAQAPAPGQVALRAAPITLGDRLGAPLGRWRAREATDVRLRPSAARPFLIFLAASIAITAATAFVLRGDKRPARAAPAASARAAAARPAAIGATVPPKSLATPRSDAPALVPPDRIELRRGKPPVLRVAQTSRTPEVLDAELCVDRRGRVASVKILTPVSNAARSELTRQLGSWRYRPIKQDGERVAGCFATRVRPILE